MRDYGNIYPHPQYMAKDNFEEGIFATEVMLPL